MIEDAGLTPEELANIQLHAARLLKDAGAEGIYPTPVDQILAAAKLVVVDDDVLDEVALQRFLRQAKAGLAKVKSALSKVLGLFEPMDRLVVIDKNIPPPRVPFVKLHEAGHGYLPHQVGMYSLMQDCEKTLDPYTTDLFENEANVFASEMLFQGPRFGEEAHSEAFSMKVPMRLAKKYGASQYASFRRYVVSSPNACCLVVLETPVSKVGGGFHVDVRRIVPTSSFHKIFDCETLFASIDELHVLWKVVPRFSRVVHPRTVLLCDRNGQSQEVKAEAFNTSKNILILLKPKQAFPIAC